jgi:hypothetical protein
LPTRSLWVAGGIRLSLAKSIVNHKNIACQKILLTVATTRLFCGIWVRNDPTKPNVADRENIGMKVRWAVLAQTLGLLIMLGLTRAEAGPTISLGSFPVNPPPSYLPAPATGTFYVPVDIAGAFDLQNWQFDLLFDNTVVEEVDPGDGSSGIYGAEFTPGDANSQSFILSGFPFNSMGLVQTVAGSYPSLLVGPSGDGPLAFILFEFLPGQSGNNPDFSIQNAAVQQPVPEPGTLGLLAAALTLLAGSFAARKYHSS